MGRNIGKKGAVFVTMVLLVGTGVFSFAGNARGGTGPLSELWGNEAQPHMEFTVNTDDLTYGIIEKGGEEYAVLSLPDQGFTTVEGEAQLPVMHYMFFIPEDAHPELSITSISWEETSLRELQLPSRIVPVQPSVSKDMNPDDVPFVINNTYYASTEFMQTEVARIVDTGEVRGHHFALVEISPIQYKPSSGELRILNQCTIKIDLPGADFTKTYERMQRYNSPAFQDIYDTLFSNYDSKDMPPATRDQEGYLIIVYDTFYDEMIPFINWKESMGYEVTVVNTSDIPGGATTTNIHNYIQDAYDTWPIPPSYVLLVGDTPQIPTYTGTTGWPGPAQAVDLYYVTVDGSDYFPDIHIGRFPASLEAHVTAMVDKTVYYEQGNFPSNDFIKKAVFMASNDNWQVSEGTHNYVINNYLLPNNYTCDKLYSHTYGATTQQVRNALNDGRSLAIYSGHGSNTYWADGPPFYQSDVQSLTNQNYYPFVCSHACLTGTFNYAECFGETWVRQANKAALAFWGASESTLWDEDDILEKKMFYSWWVDNIETIGGMTDMALYYLYQYYGGGGYTKYYFEAYNVLGDPSVKIWREEPITDVFMNYTLYSGWNLITLPFEQNLTASSLAALIPECDKVVWWDAQSNMYLTFLVGITPPGSPWDFNISDGVGYYLSVTNDTNFVINGTPLDSVNVTLYPGWNTIGWWKTRATTASVLASQITDCQMVVQWDAETGSFVTFLVGITPPNSPWDFTIEQGMGVFVKVSSGSIWTG